MKLIRNAALAATSTVLITAAGAVTGIGSSAAQAYDLTASVDTVVITLTAEETAAAAADGAKVDWLCSRLEWKAAEQSLINPMGALTCASYVAWCSSAAAGRPATLVITWTKAECRY